MLDFHRKTVLFSRLLLTFDMEATMTDKTTKNTTKPEKTIRRGAVAASIWKRQAPSGFEYFDFSLSRAWKAKSSGREGYSLNFFSDNEEQLGSVIKEAADWIAEQQASLQVSGPIGDPAGDDESMMF